MEESNKKKRKNERTIKEEIKKNRIKKEEVELYNK